MTVVHVPAARLPRWVDNFGVRHPEVTLSVTTDGELSGAAADGAHFTAALPFDAGYAGDPDPARFAEAAGAALPEDWAVLLVRKGGFAIARLHDDRPVATKVGRRHVQGRTKAGGQSQQRFARRRDNQARTAYAAAAEHAVRMLGDARIPVVCGGDRQAVAAVLEDPRLSGLRPVADWLAVPEPRRRELDRAIVDGSACRVDVHNADG